jgi:hypothetical protein
MGRTEFRRIHLGECIGQCKDPAAVRDESTLDTFFLLDLYLCWHRYAEDTAYWHPALVHALPDIQVSYERKMETKADEINESLNKIASKMVRPIYYFASKVAVYSPCLIHNPLPLVKHAQLTKMENLVNQLQDTYQRLVQLQGQDFADKSPLYATCPLLVFGKTFTLTRLI